MSFLNSDNYKSDRSLATDKPDLAKLITEIEEKLLPNLEINSINPYHPVVVNKSPNPGRYWGRVIMQPYYTMESMTISPSKFTLQEEKDGKKK